mgnify:CR=1 FL=1
MDRLEDPRVEPAREAPRRVRTGSSDRWLARRPRSAGPAPEPAPPDRPDDDRVMTGMPREDGKGA